MKVYRWLLKLLPREFRRRQGADLISAATEQLEAAAAEGRSRARVTVALSADVVYAAWSLRAGAFWTSLARDLRFAARLLGRAPGFVSVAILTLGLGIASTTTVFSIVNAFYFKPSEFPDPDRLMDISETSGAKLCRGCGVGTSYPGFVDWRDRATSFESLEAYEELPVVISAPVIPERLHAARITGSLFSVLGVAPVLGRDFTPSDDRPAAPPLVLLSHRLWQRVFGGDHTVIGRTVRVDGVPSEIVGVMPPRFGFPEFADLWQPLHSVAPSADRDNRNNRQYGVVGRLRAGVTVAQARTEMQAMAKALEREHPETQAEWSADVIRFGDDRVGPEGLAFVTMLAAVGLVLAIACGNLAALFLARGTRRHRELAVRSALGAGRLRLVRQLVIETLLIGILGGALGLLLAQWGVALARLRLYSSEVPYYLDVGVDWRVVLFSIAASFTASILVGLMPALTATRLNLVDGLKQGGAAAPGSQRRHARLRGVLIVGELALVLILLSGAGLMGRTFLRFFERPAGFDPRGLTYAQLPLAGPRFGDTGVLRTTIGELERRFEAIPDARIALSHTIFLRGFGPEARQIRVEGLAVVPPDGTPSFGFGITPNYFDTHGLKMVAGRAFTTADRLGTEPVVVVNRAMAHAIWPTGDALGHRVQLRPGVPGDPWRTIVGIISDRDGDPVPGERRNPLAYMPLDEIQGRPVDVMIRTAGDVTATIAQVRAAIVQVDLDQPLTNVRSADEEHRREYWYVGYFAVFYGSFAAFGLLLAVVGVYGVVAQTVGERAREFGIRAALGADRARLYRLVLGRSLLLALAGAALGLFGSRLTTRFLGWLLFGADPNSAVVLVGAVLVLVLTVLVASYLPARRAAMADPLVVLRSE